MKIDREISPSQLAPKIERLFARSAAKILSIEAMQEFDLHPPVITVQGVYTSRAWTDWTRGFQYGSALIQYDASGDERFLAIGREKTLQRMGDHLTNLGVHDHGFNIVSTYGNLRRLMLEGKIPFDERELGVYELALKVSGAVQAARWTELNAEEGYIYSFNGPHSLFVDTIRSLRSLAIAFSLGQRLLTEGDRPVSLLDRLVKHSKATARYNIYYGTGRDVYDVPGRVAHEAIFNLNDGTFRNPSTQQGYSPFTTWSRGLAWIILGYAEQLEYFETLPEDVLEPLGGREAVVEHMLEASRVTCEYWIERTPADGIPYWDFGAPGLPGPDDYLERPADPFNGLEPVDSSAAAIAAQGFLRLGSYHTRHGNPEVGTRCFQAGLGIADRLLGPPYLSEDPGHQGLLLHSVYHRPKGWDYIPAGGRIPHSESSMWGDYHLRELALYILRLIKEERPPAFFGPSSSSTLGS